MTYLDADVFLNAILNREKEGEIAAATSALSFNEVFWALKKHRDFNKALKATKPLYPPLRNPANIGISEPKSKQAKLQKQDRSEEEC